MQENSPLPHGAARAMMLDEVVKFQTCPEEEDMAVESIITGGCDDDVNSKLGAHDCGPPVWNAKQIKELPEREDDT